MCNLSAISYQLSVVSQTRKQPVPNPWAALGRFFLLLADS